MCLSVAECRPGAVQVKLQREADAQVKRQVEEELARLQRLSEEERCVERACRHIVDRILTLRCPNPNGCDAAFLDFEGCFDLQCSACRTHFCGWCLQFCGADAHPHVRQCAKRLSADIYFGSVEEFERSNRERRRAQLVQYLGTLQARERQRSVVTALRVQLRDLGLQDVLARFQ